MTLSSQTVYGHWHTAWCPFSVICLGRSSTPHLLSVCLHLVLLFFWELFVFYKFLRYGSNMGGCLLLFSQKTIWPICSAYCQAIPLNVSFLKKKKRGGDITNCFLILKRRKRKINSKLQDPQPVAEAPCSQSPILRTAACPASFGKGQSNCKYDLCFWEHLNGNTQAITFLSRSLNTNQTCILIGLPV